MTWHRGICAALLVSLCLGGQSRLIADDKLPEGPKELPAGSPSKEDQYYELMRVIAETFEQVDRNYVKQVDRRKLAEAALKGMMEELDPYSNYIAPDDLQRFSSTIEQEFGGIGIQVSMDPTSRRLTVMTPLPGTPAYRAGLRPGDSIREIEGKTTENMTLDTAVKMLKGKPGDPVTLKIMHLGESKPIDVKLVRAVIHVATILGDSYKSDDSWDFMIDKSNKIAYIRLTTFSRDSAEELKTALQDLQEAGMKGLILDLRFNPGGLLVAATEISDFFLETGKIVSTKGRNTQERVVYARREGTFSNFPMVILVNHFSASASEIVSAALQDHKRAVIIGERTWGKGSVQNVINLESGKSALKLTTASYHRPSGKNIHRFPGAKDTDEWGVMPNDGFTVKMSTAEMQKYLELRRQRDILGKTEPLKPELTDPQLAKGLEYLRSQLKIEAPAVPKPEVTPKPEKAEVKDKPKGDEPKADKPAAVKPAGEKPASDKPTEKPTPKPDEKPESKSKEKSSSNLDLRPILRSLLRVPHTAAA